MKSLLNCQNKTSQLNNELAGDEIVLTLQVCFQESDLQTD